MHMDGDSGGHARTRVSTPGRSLVHQVRVQVQVPRIIKDTADILNEMSCAGYNTLFRLPYWDIETCSKTLVYSSAD